MSMLARVRPELLELKGYSSARMEASGGQVLLNANESPWEPAAVAVGGLNRYPEPQPIALRRRMAELYGVAEACLLVGRGSDEAIDLLTRAFCRAGQDEVLIAPPTFGMYAVCAEVQGAQVKRIPLLAAAGFAFPAAQVEAAVTAQTKLVYVCTPNNPTGNSVPRDLILRLAERLAGRALVVVDEAYIEFSEAQSLAPEAAQSSNIAVLRTLSKAHGLAGARVGALIADRAIVAVLRRIMPPYPLPTPSVRAAEFALSDESLPQTAQRIAKLKGERARISATIAELPGVQAVLPSDANFVTVRLADSARIYAGLLRQGIVVRDVSHYPGLSDCLRITVGRAHENDALLEFLGELRDATS